MKKCGRCLIDKPLEDFAWRSKTKGTKQWACRSCQAEASKDYYGKNKSKIRDQVKAYSRAVREENRVKVIQYLQCHPCVDCGESDILVLEFDHVRGHKKMNVGSLLSACYSWSAIKREIEKCEVRCANCHRRVTLRRAGDSYKILFCDSLPTG